MPSTPSETNNRQTSWMGNAIARISDYRERRRARTQVADMPDHMLRDIGWTREELLNAIDTPR